MNPLLENSITHLALFSAPTGGTRREKQAGEEDLAILISERGSRTALLANESIHCGLPLMTKVPPC